MIKKVNINMGPFLKDYTVMGVLIVVRTEIANGSCNSQFALFITEQQRELQPAVEFSQNCLQHRSV